MAKNNADSQTIAEIIGRLTDEQLHLIDFDEVKKRLAEVHAQLRQTEHFRSELELLRNDYQNRIAGMVKAVAAVERNQHKAESAVIYLEKLPQLNASELIDEYRRTSAAFRSAFPTSFGLGLNYAQGRSRLKNPEVYK